MCCGERLEVKQLEEAVLIGSCCERLLSKSQRGGLVNLYGTTETTAVTYRAMQAADAAGGPGA